MHLLKGTMKERTMVKSDFPDGVGPEPKKCRLSSPSTMRVVLDDSYLCPIPKITVYAGTIVDKRFVSSLVKKVNQLRPLPSLIHLKRVRRNENTGSFDIILAIKEGDEEIKSVKDVFENSGEGLAEEIKLVEVRNDSSSINS